MGVIWSLPYLIALAAMPSSAKTNPNPRPTYRLVKKFFVDELYGWLVQYVQGTIATLCALFVE